MAGRIMVVDGIASNRIVMKVKLGAAGHDLRLAQNGEEAVAMARDWPPDLALIDETLPDMSGLALAGKLKSTCPDSDPAVVLLGNPNRPANRVQALASGVDEVLEKPVREPLLQARLRSLLRAADDLRELGARDRTCRALGFREAPALMAPRGWISLICEDTARGASMAAALREQGMTHRISVMTRKDVSALSLDPAASVFPDVLMHLAAPTAPGGAMGWLAEMRTQAAGRHAAIIAMMPGADPGDEVLALDLGAQDVVMPETGVAELALRIDRQLRNKRRADQLRATVADGLKQAVTDPLTGLYNRRYAEHHLNRIAREARGGEAQFALIMIDVDRFKQVNDRFGHPGGDAVLRQIAMRLRSNLRAVDLIARYGGEEFLVALPDTSLDLARSTAERLRKAVADKPFTLDGGREADVTISLGLSMGNGDRTDPGGLIALADRALYASKSDGRNALTVGRSAA